MQTANRSRDHGGGLDRAASKYGGARSEWLDLSTGINPVAYPMPTLSTDAWTALPDHAATARLLKASRKFWRVPEDCAVLVANGASALIAQMPTLAPAAQVYIPQPTYNEHAAAFQAHGWPVGSSEGATAKVIVNPNNPTGGWYEAADLTADLMIVDESFADVDPTRSLISHASTPGVVVLKSFGKFWGLAGLRLGFAIARPKTVARLKTALGPWPVSGPALEIAAAALEDLAWAEASRLRLEEDATRLDSLLIHAGAKHSGGTPLFRLYEVDNAEAWQDRLARHHIWTRIFPYSQTLIRLGLPPADGWARLKAAL